MKEKLKQVGLFIVQWLTILVVPFALIGAVIYYLYMKLTTKNQQLAQKDVENELLKSLEKKEQAKNEADKAVTDYMDVRDKYRAEHKDE